MNETLRTNVFWLFLDDFDENFSEKYAKLFRYVEVLIDTEVMLAFYNHSQWTFVDVYKVAIDRPLIFTPISLKTPSNVKENLLKLVQNPRRRYNLEGYPLPCVRVINYPEQFVDINDTSNNLLGIFAKANFPMIVSMMQDFNFSLNMLQVDNYGWSHNGTFDGLIGRLQRRETEFGCNGILMRNDRIPVIEWSVETMKLRACIVFRQPSLSRVSNIFQLPFSRNVWICILFFLVASGFSVAVLIYVSKTQALETLDAMSFVFSALCQQGFPYSPITYAGKIIYFVTFLASFFLFTSYSANIVALLQSPSKAISSVADLVESPLKMGVQEAQYNRVFFNESQDPMTRKLFLRKSGLKDEMYIFNLKREWRGFELSCMLFRLKPMQLTR